MASIQNVRTINNPQRSYLWEVDIEGLSTGGLQNLSFYAKTVSIPQIAIEQIIINHKAGRTHHAGRDVSAHTVTVTFWDDEAQTIHKFFNDWMTLMFDQKTASGNTRNIYSANMVIKLKDAADAEVTSKIKLTNVFPTDIGDVNLSYDTSEPVEYTVTFSFDSKIVE